MNKSVDREGILGLLKELDSRIVEDATIVVCGGAAGILSLKWGRATIDIDILGAEPPLSKLNRAAVGIARDYGLAENWLNDASKTFAKYLCVDFRDRLVPFEGDFRKLKVFCLSNVDLYIMKLASFRPRDREDLLRIPLVRGDINVVRKSIEKISAFEPRTALRMEYYLKEKGL